ncbi:copper homeostasis membrane protein CopD [Mesorhizobium sp. B2-3-13]|uniref:copper homeostasis membrane protein CopD n=1 Tax=unclassified Mesorhizobium TaxID=325217 RepID=UPI00112C9664|nr:MULTISPECIES: copper homeostasis membrane protein CopD [unclassified Mesorhizobium]TPJ90608.1 copper homeostasis membrane protein CopD [Mesorhizobium sp. B2-5-13]TPK54759.1 copper homeostasis membrane protein CopD [Mesorhizobium sp. B2-5-5]TPL89738.1 copper homeostasis membrane protein CopD [Mesorhizobium sp. B2-3-13]
MSAGFALAVCTFLRDTFAMLLWGTFAYLSIVVPSKLARDIQQRLQLFRIIATGVVATSTIAALPLEAGSIGDGWTDVFDRSMIWAVLSQSTVGHTWLVQAVTVLSLVAALVIPSTYRQTWTALAASLVLAGFTLTGHAAMQQGWIGFGHRLNDAIHVLSCGAWLGSLVPLLLILLALNDPKKRISAGLALRRFSKVGHVVVALVLATGVINTFLTLGEWPTNWSSPYQAMLATKMVLVLLMVSFAMLNRYKFVPQIAFQRSKSLRAIRIGTMTEITLSVCVIALVSIFGMLEPI